MIEADLVDLVPFAVITPDEVVAAGEPNRQSLRRRVAHAGPITDKTLLYRIEFPAWGDGQKRGNRRSQPKLD